MRHRWLHRWTPLPLPNDLWPRRPLEFSVEGYPPHTLVITLGFDSKLSLRRSNGEFTTWVRIPVGDVHFFCCFEPTLPPYHFETPAGPGHPHARERRNDETILAESTPRAQFRQFRCWDDRERTVSRRDTVPRRCDAAPARGRISPSRAAKLALGTCPM